MIYLTARRIFVILCLAIFIVPATGQEQAAATTSSESAEIKKKEKDPNDSSSKKIKLFKDEIDAPLEMSIAMDVRAMLGEKKDTVFQQAVVKMKLPDGTEVEDSIEIRARGNFRRDFCYFPSVMLNFKQKGQPKTRISSLGKLKMVCTCKIGAEYEQLVLKEYLTYKIYNILTPKSYRVRLAKVNFIDTENKRKPFQYYGFLIEDIDDMAKRNDAREYDVKNLHTELTDRKDMTLVALFEFMIGNLDWSVPAAHNIRLILSRDTTRPQRKPYPIPYDFDYSGLVNASYAVPPENMGNSSVTERIYRGYPRSMEELEAEIKIFKDKKDAIYGMINGFEPLSKKHKTQMTRFLDEFYDIIRDKRGIKVAFIDNARTN